jgi:tetratricopeptide (TPR) repeat protein
MNAPLDPLEQPHVQFSLKRENGDAADWVRFRRAAARAKPPLSAMATKVRRERRFTEVHSDFSSVTRPYMNWTYQSSINTLAGWLQLPSPKRSAMASSRIFQGLFTSLLGAALLIQPAARANEERFGEVNFSISCSSVAQTRFNRGVAMLHSFFYPETVKEFGALAQQEPTCAMAYWGLAISQRPNPLVGPFPGDVLKAGWEAVEKARAAPQKTDREREWIEALAAFFENFGSVPQQMRTANYEAAMARLHAHYPHDAEAAIFYALALNEAADPADKTYAKPLMAVAILEKLEAQHPNHPGIPHYIIHSYDYPELAVRGVIAANRCAQLAPSAPHALHMPSHVYSTLGMWEEVIESDLASDETTIAYTARVNPQAFPNPATIPARYHSLDFLTNAYLQTARDRQAKRIVDTRNVMAEFPAGFRYSGHTAYAAIPVRYAFERGAWAEAASLAVPKTPFPQAEGIVWFARAVGAARSGDGAGSKQALDKLRTLRETLVKAHDAYWSGQVEIQEKAAAAWLGLHEGRKAEAISLMREASDLEDKSGKHVAMENRLSPMREMFGELLLAADEPGQALPEFEASLTNNPNRYRSFAGAAKAAERLGHREQARTYYEKLVTLASNADGERPDLVTAKEFLAAR